MSGKKKMNRFLCSACRYYKTCPNRTDFDDDSKCSSEEEQQKIKQEVEQNDCDTQSDY